MNAAELEIFDYTERDGQPMFVLGKDYFHEGHRYRPVRIVRSTMAPGKVTVEAILIAPAYTSDAMRQDLPL